MESLVCDKPTEIHKITEAIGVLSGKWKPTILIYLRFNECMRFNELRRCIPGITQKMLTMQLRELEQDSLVTRKIYAEVPPRVEYRLSTYGKTLNPIIDAMHEWGEQHLGRADG